MATRRTTKFRVHTINRVLPEIRVLVDFANSKGNGHQRLTAAFRKWMPRGWEHDILFTRDRIGIVMDPLPFYDQPRFFARLRTEIRRELETLLTGDDLKVNRLLKKLDDTTQGRIHTLWTEDDAKDPMNLPFILPEMHRIKLANKPYLVISHYPVFGFSLRQLLYAMLRESVLADQTARLGRCKSCKGLTVRGRRKRDFCSDQCRWDYHNKSAERQRKRRKGGKWY